MKWFGFVVFVGFYLTNNDFPDVASEIKLHYYCTDVTYITLIWTRACLYQPCTPRYQGLYQGVCTHDF